MSVSCTKEAPDPVDDGYVEPREEIQTLYPTGVHADRATLRGSSYAKNDPIAEKGFFFSLSEMDESALAGGNIAAEVENIEVKAASDGIFTFEVTGLELGTRCHFIAYVKLSSGAYRLGGQRSFLPDNLDLGPADKPVGTAESDAYDKAEVSVKLGKFGTEKIPGIDAAMLQPKEIGVCLWESGTQTIADARTITLGTEEECRRVRPDSTVVVEVSALKGSTEYTFVPYVIVGVYRSYAADVYEMDVVYGDEAVFTTVEMPAPEVTTEAASNPTTFSVMLNGTVVFNGGDDAAEVGFWISESDDPANTGTKQTAVLPDGETAFSQYVAGLKSDTRYYFCAYIVSNAGTPDEAVAYGVTMDFKTVLLEKPSVSVTEMDYAYRLDKVTTTSATIECAITKGVDLSLTEYGIKWGLTDANLDQQKAALAYDEQTGRFDIVLDGLTPNTSYYFRPYAENAAGGNDADTRVYAFRTAVDGGKEWLFDVSASKDLYMYDRMSQGGATAEDLVYYELDPIVDGNTTYYLLDRNLGALAPFVPGDCGQRLSNQAADSEAYQAVRKHVGTYYQWGKDVPSITWTMRAGSGFSKAVDGFEWKQGLPVDNATVWPDEGNPCPDGYDVPTQQQWMAMAKAVKGEAADSYMETLYPTMRLGPTSFASATTGGRNQSGGASATAITYASVLWTKDITAATGGADSFRVYTKTQPEAQDAQITTGSPNRTAAAPVRCVRVK